MVVCSVGADLAFVPVAADTRAAVDHDAALVLVVPERDLLASTGRLAELVVRVCCVGEAFSLPMLAGAKLRAACPLTRAVLETIVEDEAAHGRLPVDVG